MRSPEGCSGFSRRSVGVSLWGVGLRSVSLGRASLHCLSAFTSTMASIATEKAEVVGETSSSFSRRKLAVGAQLVGERVLAARGSRGGVGVVVLRSRVSTSVIVVVVGGRGGLRRRGRVGGGGRRSSGSGGLLRLLVLVGLLTLFTLTLPVALVPGDHVAFSEITPSS